jgi:DnaJ like chaperone protein
MVVFKILLGLISLQLAKLTGNNPAVGLILGAIFGHFLDLIAFKKFMAWKYRNFHTKKMKAQAEADFLYCFFTLAGKICYSDGKITKEESTKIDELIQERFKLKRKDKSIAKKYFINSIKQNVAVQSLTSRLIEVTGANQKTIENTIYTLKEIAESDGAINQDEFKILFTVASVLGLDPEQSQKLLKSNFSNNQNKTQNSNENKAPVQREYEILGCKPSDNTDKIKRSYRELVSKYHPDKIISKELPQDFIDFASQKFKEVQTAYDTVRKQRGF